MKCIICDASAESTWPKKWKCWKENGKFSECLCKLLSLPFDPYKTDFQNSAYCKNCQKRVYDIYLIIRKWATLQENISQLRVRLQSDILQAIEKSSGSIDDSKKSDNADKNICEIGNVKKVQCHNETSLISLRKRILKRLSKNANLQCDCSCYQHKVHEVEDNGQFSSHDDFMSSGLRQMGKECGSSRETNVNVNSLRIGGDKSSNICHSDFSIIKQGSSDNGGDASILSTPSIRSQRKPKMLNDNSAISPGPENPKYSERFRCCKLNCIKSFGAKDDLDMHIKRHHEGIKFPCVCQQCGQRFRWKHELKSHVLKHSGRFEERCQICGKEFRTKQLLTQHLKTKHSDKELKDKCPHCEKSFISKSKLKTHLTIHTKVYPFTCDICRKGFSAKTFLNIHMTKHLEENPYRCTTCCKTFSSPRNLRIHQYTHDQSHPFKCKICHAGSPSQALLRKHMLKHNEGKSHACSVCDKRFRFPSSLKKHEKVHDGEKHFICEFCKKAFIDKYKLTRHFRTHSGEKPYRCRYCHKSFTTKEYLSTHSNRIHGKALNKQNQGGVQIEGSQIESQQNTRPNPKATEKSSSQNSLLPPFPILSTSLPAELNIFDNLPTEEELVARVQQENLSSQELTVPDENLFSQQNFVGDGFTMGTITSVTPTFHENVNPDILSDEFSTFQQL